MRVLAITNLFPNSCDPNRGIFNYRGLKELSKLCEIKVIAPLPWYNLKSIAYKEEIGGLDTYHPRFFYTPKICRSLHGIFFFLSLFKKVKELYRDYKFDIIFVPWAYPDGFGSFLIAKAINKPIVIHVLGSDINIHFNYFLKREIISRSLKNCDKVISVSNALCEKMIYFGVPENKIITIHSGVNSEIFKIMDKTEARKKLNLSKLDKIILFAGNLVEIKGVSYLIKAIKQTPADTKLLIIGDGDLRNGLIKEAENLGLSNRISFLGKQPHESIPLWMNACDVFCLPSLNEGCPNVVFEALACGKPVVASRVGGIPEIIISQDYGILVPPGNPDSLAAGITKALSTNYSPETLCKRVEGLSWKKTAQRIFEQFKEALDHKQYA